MNAATQHQPEESFVCLGDQEDEPPSSIGKFFTPANTASEMAPSLFSFPPVEPARPRVMRMNPKSRAIR